MTLVREVLQRNLVIRPVLEKAGKTMRRRKISAAGEGHSWHKGETTVINFRIEVRRRFLQGKFVTTLQCKEQGQKPDKF